MPEEPAHLCETLRQAVLALTRERGDRLLSSLDHRSYPPASCVCSYDPSAKCSLILASLANAALAEVQAELSNAPALTPERRAYLGQHQDQLTEGIAFLRDSEIV